MNKLLKSLLVLAPTLLSLLLNLSSLLSIEYRHAKKYLVCIIVFAWIAGVLFVTAWICAMMMLYLYLLSLLYTPLTALCLLLVLNLVLIGVIGLYICKVQKKILFPETRRQLRKIKRIYKEL